MYLWCIIIVPYMNMMGRIFDDQSLNDNKKKTVRALLSNAKINITLHALEWTVLLSNSSVHPHKFLLLLQANSTLMIVAITTTNNMLAYTIHSLWVLIWVLPPFVTVLMGCGKIFNWMHSSCLKLRRSLFLWPWPWCACNGSQWRRSILTLSCSFPSTVAVYPVAVLRTLVVACTLLRNCLVSTSGRTIVMLAPVSTTMGHGTPSMWPITVKLYSLWVNVPFISTTCGVKLSGWLAGLTPSRLALHYLNC